MRFVNSVLASILCLGLSQAALAGNSEKYEAWYTTTATIPGFPVQKGELHSYFDGKTYFAKTVDGAGNASSMTMPISCDTTTREYLDGIGAKPLGTKKIDGVDCTGFAYEDQVMHRPSENWLDDTGHLYYQIIRKYTGREGTWEQRRSKHVLNPTDSPLAHESSTSGSTKSTK